MGKGSGDSSCRVAIPLSGGVAVAEAPQPAPVVSEIPFDCVITFKLFPKKGQAERSDGFTIARVIRNSDGKSMMLKGSYGPVDNGGTLTVTAGAWRNDPKFGKYFSVDGISHADPSTPDAISAYLVGHGFSQSAARTLVKEHGTDTLAVLDDAPDMIPDDISEQWHSVRGQQRAMQKMHEWGMEDQLAKRVVKHFGDSTYNRLTENPYVVCDAGVDFDIIDAYTLQEGMDTNDLRRQHAAIPHVVKLGEREGELSLSADELHALYSSELDGEITEEQVATSLAHALEQGKLVADVDALTGETRYWKPDVFTIETRLYSGLEDLLSAEARDVPVPKRPADALYTEEQWGAVEGAFRSRLSVLAGGPGTGKSTTLKAVLDELDKAGDTYTLMAPTARAAKRMEETTGRASSTIHRQIGRDGMRPPGSINGEHLNEERIINTDVIVIDESSMVDARVMERVLSHMGPDTRLMLVGDPYQLPPVGAGAVLLNAIDEDRTALTNLSKPFRQAQGSLLVLNAYRMKEGKEPYWSAKEAQKAMRAETGDKTLKVVDDWRFIETDTDTQTAARVIQEAGTLANDLAVDQDSIMIASASRKGTTGVWELNKQLQELHNPHGEEIREGDDGIRHGDRVMNTQNRYERDGELKVANGDMGTLLSVEDGIMTVEYEHATIHHRDYEWDAVVPAYASTVHKLQGSEAPGIVVPVGGGRRLNRNLLYTAFTRAKQQCVVVGSKDKLMTALTVDGTVRGANLDLSAGGIRNLVARRTALADAQRAAHKANA